MMSSSSFFSSSLTCWVLNVVEDKKRQLAPSLLPLAYAKGSWSILRTCVNEIRGERLVWEDVWRDGGGGLDHEPGSQIDIKKRSQQTHEYVTNLMVITYVCWLDLKWLASIVITTSRNDCSITLTIRFQGHFGVIRQSHMAPFSFK